MWWYLQNIFIIFPWICIVFDLIDASSYFIHAFISSIFILIISMFAISTKFECFNHILIIPDVKNKSIYVYLHIIRITALIWLFIMQTSSGILISNIFFWWSHFSITVYSIIQLMQVHWKDLIIMTIYNVSILVYIPLFHLSVNPRFQSSIDTAFCLLLSFSIFLSTAVILYPTAQITKLCWKLKDVPRKSQI